MVSITPDTDLTSNTKLYNRVSSITHILVDDTKREMKRSFSTILQLEPLSVKEINIICDITHFDISYIRHLQKIVYCRTYNNITFDIFWLIMLEFDYKFAKDTHNSLHKKLFNSFCYSSKTHKMTMYEFIIACSILQNMHKRISFDRFITTAIFIHEIVNEINKCIDTPISSYKLLHLSDDIILNMYRTMFQWKVDPITN